MAIGAFLQVENTSKAPIDPARLRVISAATDLFHKKGFRTTHLEEIRAAARVTGRELSRHFRTKVEIAEEVVNAYLLEIRDGRSRLHHRLNSWPDLKGIFTAHLALQKRFKMLRGCPLGVIGNELTEADEALRKTLSLVLEALTHNVAEFLRKEKSERRLLAAANEEQLAEFCISVLQGAMIMGKVQRDSRCVAAILERLATHLHQYEIPSDNPTFAFHVKAGCSHYRCRTHSKEDCSKPQTLV